jgi:hypothetical protein
MQTEIAIAAGQTVALDDVLGRWFGSGIGAAGNSGVLRIRALNAVAGTGRTLATSRLFNAGAFGSYGQFITAVPLSKFASASARQSLVALSQSGRFRTNLGVVEGTGNAAKVAVDVFDGHGSRVSTLIVDLGPGEHRQLGALLNETGVDLTNARVDLSVIAGLGKVFGFASVIDNLTGDPSFIPPVDTSMPRARRYTIAGVANLASATGRWQTDVRLFNAGLAAAQARVEFFPQGESNTAAIRDIEIAPGETLAFDDVLASLFGLDGAGGALRISTSTDSTLVPTGRTYHNRPEGTFGQFIPAATEAQTTGLGSEPLRILQVEDSPNFRTNLVLSETSGNPARVEITVNPPNGKASFRTELELRPNEFRQFNALLRAMGLDDTYNATLQVRVTGGGGRILAGASVIDNKTQDPIYVMAQ